jgi:uncharacterized protein with von Willebrand factor type A (vWA) domain
MNHPALDVVQLGRSLRDAGLAIGVDQVTLFARSLELVDIMTRSEIYLAARTTLVTRREDLAIFDDEFDRWLGGELVAKPAQKMPMAPRHDMGFVKTALGSWMAERARQTDREVTLPEVRTASPHEQVQTKDFATCTDAERDAITRLMQQLHLQVARRESLRRTPARRGSHLDFPRLVRNAARHGGHVFSLPRRERKMVRRPLVVLADISGSMELYTRLVLQFLHTLSKQHGATEVFVFATRLTRITPQLALRDLDAALDRAAYVIADYASGTRIAECFHEFDRKYARRVVRRGAVVLVISDGLDTGSSTALAREVRRLQSRAHRLVWLNPLIGSSNYQPLAEGMSAAMPYVDDFLPVRDLRSLGALAHHLAAIPRRRGSRLTGAVR